MPDTFSTWVKTWPQTLLRMFFSWTLYSCMKWHSFCLMTNGALNEKWQTFSPEYVVFGSFCPRLNSNPSHLFLCFNLSFVSSGRQWVKRHLCSKSTGKTGGKMTSTLLFFEVQACYFIRRVGLQIRCYFMGFYGGIDGGECVVK